MDDMDIMDMLIMAVLVGFTIFFIVLSIVEA